MTRIFVGSSVEGRPYAQMVANILHSSGAEPLLWWDAECFPVGKTLIESLPRLLDIADGALIVATPDDETTRRGETYYTPAANLLLEYGLFAGRLGTSRVAIVLVDRPRLASDLAGIVHIELPPHARRRRGPIGV